MANKITGKGSFRGVPFLIEEEQGLDGGRRIVSHEYPLRDEGLTEDMGKRLRRYQVSCLVIGDDHIEQAEKLIDALEASGAGTLKHPYFGTLEVRVDDTVPKIRPITNGSPVLTLIFCQQSKKCA